MSEYSDLDRQIEQLKRCEIIKENEVKALCAKAREILVEEGNVQRVDSPVTVSLFSLLFFSIQFRHIRITLSYSNFMTHKCLFVCLFLIQLYLFASSCLITKSGLR